jgi:hypothetical protein
MSAERILLGIRAYAKRRGVTHAAVQKAIRTGRLSESISADERGQKRIDAELADVEWEKNSDPGQRRDPGMQPPNPIAGQQHLFKDSAGNGKSVVQPGVAQAFLTARTSREYYGAQQAKMRYERDAGRLLEADAVHAEAFRVARGVRDALLAIPPRIAAALAAERKPRAIEERLREEITQALEKIATQGRFDDGE